MAIIGLGKNKEPFLYFDSYIEDIDWKKLHDEVCYGISQSHWHKKFVSSGVHEEWKELEIATKFQQLAEILDDDQIEIFKKFKTTDERIKFLTALTDVAHPFWLIFLRWNRRIESTGIYNKSVSEDCVWTEDALYFPYLKSIIEKMPFESIGRILIFMTESNNQTVPHFDVPTQQHREEKPNDDFIWFKTKDNSKNIFVYDEITKEKFYPEHGKRFVWFNEMDYHGTDPVPHFSFSIRIDGKFLPEVREQILNESS